MNFIKKLFGIKTKENIKNPEIKKTTFEPDPKKGNHTDKFLYEFINNAEPEYLQKWFSHYTKTKYYMHDGIYLTARDRVNSFDDKYFLDMMEYLEPNEIQKFLNKEREEGTYPSDKAYAILMKKQYSITSAKYLNKIKLMTNEKALKWFSNQKDEDVFPYLSDEIYNYIDKIAIELINKNTSKPVSKELYDYAESYFRRENEELENSTKLKIYNLVISEAPNHEIFFRPSAFKLKKRGLLHELMNNKKEAISDYKKAIEIDPKIGLKRKLKKLLE